MKSGTSSLYRWIAEQPECAAAGTHEPQFFSDDDAWAKGLDWYSSLFEAAGGRLVGDRSTHYTWPDGRHERAAERIADVLPDVPLLCVVRHPVERARSHYRHEFQRGRERRDLVSALADPGALYLPSSRYFACLTPYFERFPAEQLCVVRMEDVVSEEAPGWAAALAHLGLPWRPPPARVYNATGRKTPVDRTTNAIRSSRAYRRVRPLAPASLRRWGRRTIQRRAQPPADDPFAGSRVAIPQHVTAPLWADVALLEDRLGRPLWARDE